MTSTSTLRNWWSDYLCDTSTYERVAFPGPLGPDQWNLYVARAAVPAFEVMADIMERHGYLFRESTGGTYNCRFIGGTTSYSLHSYAVCIDLNPSKNPYGTTRTDMPTAFTDELADLKTGNGSRVFTWGMAWTPTSSKDPMHWQIDCSPSDVASGIIYNGGKPDMGNWKKPGDAVEDIEDADRVFEYQGSFAPGTNQASYNPADLAEANDRIWMVMARQADWAMRQK